MLTVYFDSQCGLCSKEIRYYQDIAPENRFEWKDVAQHHQELTAQGITFEAAMYEMHAIDDKGKVVKGVDAFIAIWSEIPKFRWLARVISLPAIKPLGRLLYWAFARSRYKLSSHCQIHPDQHRKHSD